MLSRNNNSFALFFALVNLPEAREKITTTLIQQIKQPVIELTLSQTALQDTTLDNWLQQELKNQPQDAIVFLYNFGDILPSEKEALRKYLQQLNWRRSALAAIKRPLVIWLPRYAIDTLAEYAPDFYDWYSNVYEFATDSKQLAEQNKRFNTEFSTEVSPAERMSHKEKKQWLQTLTNLLDENKEKNIYRASLLNELGLLHRSLGNNNDALDYYLQSLEIQQEIGDKSGEGTTLNNISQIYAARGDYETALTYLKQSLDIRQEIGDKSGEGTTLNNISQIYDARGDYETALTYLKQSLDIQQEIGDKSGLCATLFNMGHIYLQNEQQKEALEAWVTVYKIAKPMNLAQALEALEGLAGSLGLEGGLDAWEKLADQLP